ncbi:unnamed protein product [Blepharisma stoltei]|uniref:Major facilitator superfamily (MFS) profile domain-containing protein n=1 Tax=Blepharisma stoltei TaxID=1481888 RepID=A0AAU9JUB2_9CILI|nr:unnamed protein product [Blepharisma stoltei]
MVSENDYEKEPLVDKSEENEITWKDIEKQEFAELAKSPYDLWLIYVIKFVGFDWVAIMFVVIAVYCTDILDLSDPEYGAFAFACGFACLFSAFFLGNLPDKFGIRKSILTIAVTCLIAYMVLVTVSNVAVRLFFVFIIMCGPLFLNNPILKYAVKKYTTGKSRSLAFSFYLCIMFFGECVSSIFVGVALSIGDTDESTFRLIFLVIACILVVIIILTFFLRELDFEYRAHEEVDAQKKKWSTKEYLTRALSYKSFWRYLGLILLESVVFTLENHIAITLPLYMERDIDEDAPFAYFIGLYQILMTILCPSLSFLVNYFEKYTLFLMSSVIISVAPLVFVIDSSYTTLTLFIVLESIGSSVFLPRLTDYASEITPHGIEGIYFALSSFPFSVGFMLAGLTAGVTLDSYCPEDGEKECWKVWLIISVISSTATITLFLTRKWLEEPVLDTHPFVSWSKWSKEEDDEEDDN